MLQSKNKAKTWILSIGAVLMASFLVLSGIGIYFKLNLKKSETKVNPLDFSIDAWDGKSSSEYEENFAGRGYKTRTIDSAESFIYFVNEVNNGSSFEGLTVYLNKSIDLKGYRINSIGNELNSFKGTFDGGFYTLYNLNIEGNGLFGKTEYAEIKNIGLYNPTIKSAHGIAGGLIGTAVNTKIDNTFVNGGTIKGDKVGGLVGEYIITPTASGSMTSIGPNNVENKISNSFADTKIKANSVGGLVHTLTTETEKLTIEQSYYNFGETVVNQYQANTLETNKVLKPNGKISFNDWEYNSKYENGKTWCDYEHLDGSKELKFNHPIQSGFVKVYLTGSHYESVVITGDNPEDVVNVSNLSEAFTEINDSTQEATINLIVEKVFMEARAETKSDTVITVNAIEDTTLVRGTHNEDSMFVATENSKIVLGSATETLADGTEAATITLDGNREQVEKENLDSGALVVGYGGAVEIHDNVILQNNVNTNVGYGGAVLIYGSEEQVNIGAEITNCSAEYSGGGICVVGLDAHIYGEMSNCSTLGNGGAIAILEDVEETESIKAMSKLYGNGASVQPVRTTYSTSTTISAGVSNSTATSSGGAIYASASVTLTLYNSGSAFSFTDNSSTGRGGAIYSEGPIKIQSRVNFTNNKAGNNDTGIYYGGAICNLGEGSLLEWSKNSSSSVNPSSTFQSNALNVGLSGSGGAVYTYRFVVGENCTVEFLNNSVNSTRSDGTGAANGGAMTITRELRNLGTLICTGNSLSGADDRSGSAISFTNSSETTAYLAGTVTISDNIDATDGSCVQISRFWNLTIATSNFTVSHSDSAHYPRHFSLEKNGCITVTADISGKVYKVSKINGGTFTGNNSESYIFHNNGGNATAANFDVNSSMTLVYDTLKSNYGVLARMHEKPTLSNYGFKDAGTYEYYDNGSTITPTIENFNATYMTKSGTESASAPSSGPYTITISLNSGNYWMDGTNSDVVLKWRFRYPWLSLLDENGNHTQAIGVEVGTANIYTNDLYSPQPISLTRPTKTGYTFLGWYTSKSAGSRVLTETGTLVSGTVAGFTSSGKWTNGNARRLYQQWTPNVCAVAFNGNGSTSGSMSNQTITYGTAQYLTTNAFKKSYTVTFNANSGSVSPTSGTAAYKFDGWSTKANGSVEYADGADVSTLPATYAGTVTLYAIWSGGTVTLPIPTRAGYTFKGWYSATSGGTQYTASSKITAKTTMYAQWTANTYTVKYNGNGNTGGSTASSSHTYDTAKALTANGFTKTGYDFAGWAKTATGSVAYADKASVKNLTSTANGTVTLYAKWTQKTYKLTIATTPSGYGTVDKTNIDSVPHGSKITVSGNKITVNGTTVTATATAATAQYTYSFSKWSVANDASVTSTLTITATFTRATNNYKVLWKNQDGTSTLETDSSVAYGTKPSYDGSTPTKASTAQYSYTFVGWNTKTNQTTGTAEASLSTITGAVTYYAAFSSTLRTYTVTVQSSNTTYGTVSPTSIANVPYGSAITVSGNTITVNGTKATATAKSVTGYTISYSWSVSNGATVTGDLTITATFTAIPITYTVTYNGNGHTSGSTANSSHTYDTAKALTTNGFAKAGYSFKNWNTKADGTGASYADKASVKNLTSTKGGTVTLYAQWSVKTYTVTANANGGSIPSTTGWSGTGTTASKSVTYNSTYGTLPTPTRNGYTFAGWETNLYDQTMEVFKSGYYYNGSTGAYVALAEYDCYRAYLLPNTTYILTNSGGSTAPGYAIFNSSGTVLAKKNYANTETITFTTPANTSYIVFSVVTKSSSSRYDKETFSIYGKVDSTIKMVKPINHTLTAKWNLDNYTITYNLNGGTVSPENPTTYTYETASFTLNKPTKAGYEFSGWTGSNGTTASQSVTITKGSTGNKAYTANWELNVFTVTWKSQDGATTLETDELVPYGTQPSFDGNDPSKDPTAQYLYSFVGWSKSKNQTSGTAEANLGVVTGAVTYYAAFSATVKTYTVNVQSNNTSYGKVSAENVPNVPYGKTITVSGNSITVNGTTVTATANTITGYTCKLSKWSVANNATVTGNLTITATFTKEANNYVVAVDHANATNLIPNPSFENTGWSGTGVAYSTDYKHSGSYSVKLTGTTSTSEILAKTSSTIQITAGHIYYVSVYGYQATKTSGAKVQCYWPIAEPSFGSLDVGAAGQWNLYSFRLVRSKNNSGTTWTGNHALRFDFDNKSTAGVMYFDSAKLIDLTATYGAGNEPSKAWCDINLNGMQSIKATYDSSMPSITKPTRTGYTFNGIYDAPSGGNQYYTSAGTSARTWNNAANTTLYAQWTANTYTVKYNGNGNTSGTTASSSHTYDVAKALTANGYVKAYTVTYNYNGSGASNTKATATYKFAGWARSSAASTASLMSSYVFADATALASGETIYSDKQTVSNLTATNGDTITLYAQWESSSVTLPTPTRTGYTFAGWNTKADGTGTSYSAGASYTPTKTITLYAQWTANTYTVKYNGNGSTSGTTANSTHTYDVAKALTANGFARAYTVKYNANGGTVSKTNETATYTFNGWATSANGAVAYTNKETVKNLTATANGTVDLYAKWASASVTLPTPTRTGYTFTGWYTAASGGTKKGAAGASFTPTAEITLYAQWTVNTFTVTWNGNATAGDLLTASLWNYAGSTGYTSSTSGSNSSYTASGVNATSTVTYGVAPSYKTPIPVRRGYTFNGWFTATSGGTKVADNAGSFVASVSGYTDANKKWIKTESATLYAQYTAKSYNITVNNNGGTGSSNATYTTASAATISAPTRTGYTFAGWTVSVALDKMNYATINMSSGVQEYNSSYSSAVYYELFHLKSGVSYTGTLSGSNIRWRSYNASTGAYIGNVASKAAYSGDDSNIVFWYHLGNTNDSTAVSFSAAAGNFVTSTYGLTGDVTLTAKWTANTNTSYTVYHYQEKVDNSEALSTTTCVLKDTQKLSGTTAANATPAVKSYTGFIAPSTQTVTIAADGSTKVYYYYTRNSYALTLSKGTGISAVTGAGTYDYGKSVAINATVSSGYTWSTWTKSSGTTPTTFTASTKSQTIVMGAGEVTLTASATLNSSTIKLGTATNCEVYYGTSSSSTTTKLTTTGFKANANQNYYFKVKLLTESGYTVTFKNWSGWFSETTETSSAHSFTDNEQTYTVSATATKTSNNYTVIYDTDGGYVNLLKNSDVEDVKTNSSVGWDNSLNGTIVPASGWGTGWNSGVQSPTIGYHTHVAKINGNHVIRFKTNEAYVGQKDTGSYSKSGVAIPALRWLGINQTLGTSLTAGHTYRWTMDVYRVSGEGYVYGGPYYTTTTNTSLAFQSGSSYFRVTKSGEWQTISNTFTIAPDYYYDSKNAPRLYLYGHAAQGEIYVDNITLVDITSGVTQTTTVSETYGSNYQLTPTVPARLGYSFVGWETNLYSPSMEVFKDGYYYHGTNGDYVEYAEYDCYKAYLLPNTTYILTNSGQSSAPGYAIFNSSGTLLAKKNYSSTKTITFTTPANASYIVFSVVTQSSSYRYDKDTFSIYGKVDSTIKMVKPVDHTVKAKWIANVYTVAYNGNGSTSGTTANSIHTYDVKKALTANGFSKTGYTFNGWNTKADGTGTSYSNKESVSNLCITNDGTVTLYAQWKINTYVVTWKSQDGATTLETDSSVAYGTKPSFDGTNPTKASTAQYSYTFAGWSTSANQTSGTAEANLSAVTGAVTYYATFSATVRTYKVSIVSNNTSYGTVDKASVENVPYGSTITVSGNTIKVNGTTVTATAKAITGYTVTLSWSVESGATVGGPTTIMANFTATPNTYTIAFNANGGSGTMASMTGCKYDTSYTLTANSFTRTGYTFAGWATTAGGSVAYDDVASVKNLSSKAGGTVTLYAKWTANTYTVKYNGNGNNAGATANSTHTYDTSKALTANGFTKIGYSFNGWNTKANGSGTSYADKASVKNLTATNGGTVTLYAQWKINNYTITASANGGTIPATADWSGTGATATKSVTYNSTYGTLPTPTRTGYTFAGWETNLFDKAMEVYKSGYYYNGNTGAYVSNAEFSSYIAYLSPNASYTITNSGKSNVPGYAIFDSSGTVLAKKNYANTETVTFTSPANASYIVFSVVTDSASNRYDKTTFSIYGKVDSAIKMVKPINHTLTAKWNLDNYTITYNLDGGTVSPENPATYTYETASFTLNKPTKTGYTFSGWTGSNGTTANTTVTIAKGSTGNKTYTANWKLIDYTISYNLQGGSVSKANPATYNIKTESFTLNNPTKTGYTFTGWTGSNGTTASTKVTISKGSTGNKTYTANWKINTFTVTIVSNNTGYGTVNSGEVKLVPYGSTITFSGNKFTIAPSEVTGETISSSVQVAATNKSFDNTYYYEFKDWTVGGNLASTMKVTDNVTITANFIRLVEIKVETEGANGNTYGVNVYNESGSLIVDKATESFKLETDIVYTIKVAYNLTSNEANNKYQILRLYLDDSLSQTRHSLECESDETTIHNKASLTRPRAVKFKYLSSYFLKVTMPENTIGGITLNTLDTYNSVIIKYTANGGYMISNGTEVKFSINSTPMTTPMSTFIGFDYVADGEANRIGVNGGTDIIFEDFSHNSQHSNNTDIGTYYYKIANDNVESLTVLTVQSFEVDIRSENLTEGITLTSQHGFNKAVDSLTDSLILYAGQWEVTTNLSLAEIQAVFYNQNVIQDQSGKIIINVLYVSDNPSLDIVS